MLRRLAVSYSLLVVAEFSAKLLNFGAHRTMAVELGSDGLGRIDAVNAFVMIGASLAWFGQETLFLREAGRREDQRARLLGNAVMLRVCTGLVAMALFNVLAANLESYGHLRALVLVASISFLTQALRPYRQLFDVALRSGWPAFLRVSLATVNLLALLVALPAGAGPMFVIGLGVGVGLAEGLLWRHFAKEIARPDWRPEPSLLRTLAKDGAWLVLPQISIFIYMRIDQVFLYSLQDASDVGFYAVAAKITELIMPFSVMAMALLMPFVTRAANADEASLGEVSRRLFRAMSGASVLLCLLIVGSAPAVLGTVYGEEFLASADSLTWLVWSQVWVFTGVANNHLLVALGRQRLDVVFTAGNAVVNIFLNILLIPWLGPVGAAIATTISYGTGAVLGLLFEGSKKLSVELLGSVAKPALAALLAWGTVSLSGPWPLASHLGLLGGAYVLALVAMGGYGWKDLSYWATLRKADR